eukprot:TRINITY_DN10661_c0_g1_i1.p1 TRINITY_DN10661_c0_g1~~TRINITY_DN10661_c0_g1_i1.p1  ORF type:complete len:178 (+),score=39.27 TRINITY_DN10661_c0_g1_i1:546-1079(+)
MDACLLGIIFARFARNRKNTSILFSERCIITHRMLEGSYPVLVFRIANMRQHQLIDGRLRMYLAYTFQDADGCNLRFDDMKVDTTGMVFFSSFPFIVTHIIDEQSPLFNHLDELDHGAEILVLFEAVDTSTSNSIQSRFSYKRQDVVFGGKFVNIVHQQKRGRLEVDFTFFHAIQEK